MYRKRNSISEREIFMITPKAAALLFEAIENCLRTQSILGTYKQNKVACMVCGKETERIHNIGLECCCIHRNSYKGHVSIPKTLAFKGSI